MDQVRRAKCPRCDTITEIAQGEHRICSGAGCSVTLRLPPQSQASTSSRSVGRPRRRKRLVVALSLLVIGGLLTAGWQLEIVQPAVATAGRWLRNLLLIGLGIAVLAMLASRREPEPVPAGPQRCRAMTKDNRRCSRDGLARHDGYCSTHKWEATVDD